MFDEFSQYGDVLVEANTSNAVQTSYVLGQGELLSQNKVSDGLSYFLKDGQGSVRALTDPAGSLISNENYSYDAFGNLIVGPTNPATNYLYTGQQFDPLTNLYSLRARYYTPQQGRFLSRDTWPVDFNNPIELNRYGYTANNPINSTDPTGNEAILDRGIISGVGIRAAPSLKILGYVATSLLVFALTLTLTESSNKDQGCPPGTYNCQAIRFTQDTISENFRNEEEFGSVYDLVGKLKAKQDFVFTIEAIKIFRKVAEMDQWGPGTNPWNGEEQGHARNLQTGQVYSLDNRRLFAFKLAGLTCVPVQWLLLPAQVRPQVWKFTTKNFGVSIALR